jgi:uncharacterized protein (TIGR02145 family)
MSALRWATVLLGAWLCGCASVPASVSFEGKRWSAANLDVDVPGSYCYGDDAAHCKRYGRLYTWTAAMAVCPTLGHGWRLPTMDEWRRLARGYGGVSGDGADGGQGAFRDMGMAGRSGLRMPLGGGRDERGSARLEAHGFFWSATEDSATTAHFLNFAKGRAALFDQDGGEKAQAFSVRCIRD